MAKPRLELEGDAYNGTLRMVVESSAVPVHLRTPQGTLVVEDPGAIKKVLSKRRFEIPMTHTRKV